MRIIQIEFKMLFAHFRSNTHTTTYMCYAEHKKGTLPLAIIHSFGFSSDPSLQSFSPSQANETGMHLPSPHLNCRSLHGTGSSPRNLSEKPIIKWKMMKMRTFRWQSLGSTLIRSEVIPKVNRWIKSFKCKFILLW